MGSILKTPLVDRGTMEAKSASVRLSKSKIAAFEHCARRLWLQVYRPDLGQHDEATLGLFEAGHRVGELARLEDPGGILVADDHRHILAAIANTRQLLNATTQRPIFEAAFHRETVVVRVDVMRPDGWGGWSLIEVKNSGGVKPYQLLDVATQAWVLRGNGICLSSMVIRHPERPLRPWSQWPAATGFVDVDVSPDVSKLMAGRKSVVDAAKSVLGAREPVIKPGRHCTRPFRCEFREHCSYSRD